MSDLSCGKILPPKEGLYQGAFLADSISESAIESFAQKSGSEVDIVLKFLAFATGLYFPTKEAQAVSDKGGAIFIKLEPWSWKGKNDSSFPLSKIIAGQHDYLLRRFAEGARNFGKPIFVSFAHEMNGDWYPWSGNPELYQKAFQHVHKVISEIAPNITWVWNPNVDFPAAPYYPGDKYADWVAIDGYNWNGSTPIPAALKGLNYLKTLKKPVMIGEFACARDNTTCLTNFIEFAATDKSIKAFIYFDKDKEKKWAIKEPAEKAAYQRAIKKYEALFKGRIQSVPCQKERASSPTPPLSMAPAAPGKAFGIQPFGRPDPELGKEGVWELNRAKVEENTSLDHLRKIFLVLSDIPQTRILRTDIYKYTGKEFEKLYPELIRIRDLESREGYGHKLFWYLRDFRNHWNNTVLLFAVYLQKISESTEELLLETTGKNKDQNIEEALTMARKLKLRIKTQLTADRATGKNRGPSDYSLANLNLITAELYSQNKNQDDMFYMEGIRMVIAALDEFVAIENKTTFPSRSDYFSITKGIMVMADLLQQLGHATTDPAKRSNYFEIASYLYGRIGALKEPKSIEENGEGLFIDIASDVLKYMPETQRNELLIELPELSYFMFNVPVEDIRAALEFNADRGYISRSDSSLSEMGIFSLLKGIALIKQAGLFAGWPRAKDPAEYLFHLSHLSEGMKQIKLWNEYLVDFHAKDPAELQQKSEYSMTLAGLIQGELLLSLADRIRYFANHKTKWSMLVDEYNSVWDKIENEDYYKNSMLASLPTMTSEKDKKALADELIKVAEEFYFYPNENRTYPYLYAWSKVKQLEIQVRLAEYIKYLDRSGQITDDKEKQAVMFADVEDLVRIHDEVGSLLNSEDYLRLEANLITSSLLLSGIPIRKGDRYRILSMGNKTIAKEWRTDRVIELLNEIKAGAGYLPALNQRYFSTLLIIKEAQARIQKAKNEAERRSAAGKTLEPLIATAIEIGYGIPTHIYHQIMELDKLIIGPKKDLAEANSILRVLPDIIGALEIDSLSAEKKETLAKMKTLTRGIRSALARRNYASAASQAVEMQKAARRFNDRESFARVSEALVWDMHSLKAELFHQIAINYALRKKDRLIYEFSISAYLECDKSGSNYDRKMRINDIEADTGLTEDKIAKFKRKYGDNY